MRTTQQVSVLLGETSERQFKVNVTCEYDGGDYYNPPTSEFYIDGDIYDDLDGVVNDLIERYESIFKVDFEQMAIDEFKSLN